MYLVMGSARRKAERSYLKLPGAIRSITDPVVKNRGRIQSHVAVRGERGGSIVRKAVSRFFNKRSGRKKR